MKTDFVFRTERGVAGLCMAGLCAGVLSGCASLDMQADIEVEDRLTPAWAQRARRIDHADGSVPGLTMTSPQVVACLRRARALLRAGDAVFQVMFSALSRPQGHGRRCRTVTAESPFLAFEGWWHGRWNAMPVAHLWLTTQPGVQLVAIRDGVTPRRGINLAHDGTLCGIVMGPDGAERLHYGRFRPATDAHPAHLQWSTPSRNYYERVACGPRGPTYEIVEEIKSTTGPVWGTTTRYRAPEAVVARMRVVHKYDPRPDLRTISFDRRIDSIRGRRR